MMDSARTWERGGSGWSGETPGLQGSSANSPGIAADVGPPPPRKTESPITQSGSPLHERRPLSSPERSRERMICAIFSDYLNAQPRADLLCTRFLKIVLLATVRSPRVLSKDGLPLGGDAWMTIEG